MLLLAKSISQQINTILIFKHFLMRTKFYLKTYFLISSCFMLQLANAQINDSEWSIGPVAGFKAIKSLVIYDTGISLSRSISEGKRLNVEVGYRFSGPTLEQNWGSRKINMETDISSLMLGASYHWFPFLSNSSRGSFLESVKVIGGVWYLNNPDYKFVGYLDEPIVWGEVMFTPEEVGNVTTVIATNKLQPFVGLGYDNFYKTNKISFSVNGGILYQGKPEVTMVATNMLKPTEESAERFEQNLSSYQFSPFIQLLIHFNLK